MSRPIGKHPDGSNCYTKGCKKMLAPTQSAVHPEIAKLADAGVQFVKTQQEAIGELLETVQTGANKLASDLYTERLIPILRKITGYTGEVSVKADTKTTFDAKTGKLMNDVSLSLQYPTKTNYVDAFETAQRMILEELFKQIIERYSNKK